MEHKSHLIYISFESEWLRKTGNIVRRRQDTSGHHTPTAEMPYLALSAPSLLNIHLEYLTPNRYLPPPRDVGPRAISPQVQLLYLERRHRRLGVASRMVSSSLFDRKVCVANQKTFSAPYHVCVSCTVIEMSLPPYASAHRTTPNLQEFGSCPTGRANYIPFPRSEGDHGCYDPPARCRDRNALALDSL